MESPEGRDGGEGGAIGVAIGVAIRAAIYLGWASSHLLAHGIRELSFLVFDLLHEGIIIVQV